MNRLDRVISKDSIFTLHAEISGDVIAKGSIMEITKVLTAMKCYGTRVDKFYVMSKGVEYVNADFISAEFILLRCESEL